MDDVELEDALKLKGKKVFCGGVRWVAGVVVDVARLKDARIRLVLDWGKLGRSRVFMHDRGRIWHLSEDLN